MPEHNIHLLHHGIDRQRIGTQRSQQRNNSNNRNPVLNIRDRVFHVMFVKVALTYAKILPPSARRLFEYAILTKAFIALFILAYIHFAFIRTPIDCLDNLHNNWPKDGILRVEVVRRGNEKSFNMENTAVKSDIKDFIMSPNSSFDYAWLTFLGDKYKNSKASLMPIQCDNENSFQCKTSRICIPHSWYCDGNADCEDSSDEPSSCGWSNSEYIMEYSLEYGFLRLSSNARKKLNIPIKIVILDAKTEKCFGDWFSRLLLDEYLGYDDVLLASLKHLAEKDEQKGFVRNVISGEHHRFVSAWMTDHTAYITAAIVMMSFTLAISMLLRYSHHQVFVFIIDLLHTLEMDNSITFPVAPLLIVILALVGIEAVMSEFFNDNTIAFYIILIVWMADQYDNICCHTAITKRHWLRFFYLYFYAFYVYNYRFNGQYNGLALLTSWFFIQHTMLYFFHHYELPAILQARAIQLPLHNIILIGRLIEQRLQDEQHPADNNQAREEEIATTEQREQTNEPEENLPRQT